MVRLTGKENPMASLVLREDRDGIATLTLNRPEKLNSLSQPLFMELRTHLEELEQQTEQIGLVVIRGAGKGFSAGNDIDEMSQHIRQPQANFKAKTVELIAHLPQPVICAVHGVCYTGALELALACDFIVANQSARFADTHAKLGLIPMWGMSQRLPRRVGTAKAIEMMTTSRPYSGEEALAMGLVNYCFADESFEAELRKLTETIAANSWHTLRGNKRLLRETQGMPLEQGLAHEIYRSPGPAPDIRQRLAGFSSRKSRS
jgi:enoyl-CoA hydratase/carnithine racemase